jgi:hypothetical protein
LPWHIILIENGFYWTFGYASAAVDALIGMDVDHIRIFIEAIDWTNLEAGLVFAAHAGFSDNHCHV